MIYVDKAIHKTGPNGRVKYAHMTADTLKELHEFAASIGVKKCWFEYSRRGIPHYDINERVRKIAIEKGAKEL